MKPPKHDTQHPAAVFAARIRAALAYDRAAGSHLRTFCDPSGFDPTAADVVDALASAAADEVARACAALCVERSVRAAVACRLAEHWLIHDIEAPPLGDVRGLDAAARERALWMADGFTNIATMEFLGERAGAIPPRIVWPSNVSPDDVLAVVSRCKHKDARVIATSLRAGQWYVATPDNPRRLRPGAIFPRPENYAPVPGEPGAGRIADPELSRALGTVFHPRFAALVAWAEKDVEESRRRSFIAVDAGRCMDMVLTSWSRQPVDKRGRVVESRFSREEREQGFRVVVRDPGKAQLLLPIDGVGGDILDAVRSARGPGGLRHFAAFLLQFTKKGARSGRMTWTVAEHMAALQCGADTRRDPRAREALTREATAVARLQLEVYDDSGAARIRQELFHPINEAERLDASGRWTLEGMELEAHPWINRGVRAPSGEIGTNWFPASPELPALHQLKHSHAILAGLRLPQRWRWAYGENGRTFVDLTGANALALFGVEADREHHKGRAWETLDANVAALQGLQTPGVGAVEWLRGARTPDGVLRLHAARWQVDRIAHRIAPIEATPPPPLRSGDDLLAWREGRGLTQAQVAAALGVSLRTVKGAEGEGSAPLPRSIRAAVAAGALSSPATPAALPTGR